MKLLIQEKKKKNMEYILEERERISWRRKNYGDISGKEWGVGVGLG